MKYQGVLSSSGVLKYAARPFYQKPIQERNGMAHEQNRRWCFTEIQTAGHSRHTVRWRTSYLISFYPTPYHTASPSVGFSTAPFLLPLF